MSHINKENWQATVAALKVLHVTQLVFVQIYSTINYVTLKLESFKTGSPCSVVTYSTIRVLRNVHYIHMHFGLSGIIYCQLKI